MPGETDAGADSSTRGQAVWACLGLTAANLFAYFPIWRYPFLSYDDTAYVTANPMVQKGLTLKTIGWAWTTGYFAYWHPLTWLSHMLDIQVYGAYAGGHHLTNLVLHAASTVLLFLALREMTRAPAQSAFVAALFALHPLHVQTVAWVAERKGVLSAFFSMLSLLTYARYARRPGLLRYLAVATCVAMALMSKPMAVTLPLALLLLDVWPLGRLWPEPGSESAAETSLGRRAARLLLEKAPLLALSVASAIATLYIVSRQGNLLPPSAFPVTHAAPYAACSYFTYIRKALWPSDLAAFYPFPRILQGWDAVAAGFALAGISLCCLREVRRRPYFAVGWFWFLGTFLPVIGLVQSQGQTVADRYSYVPLIGLFIVLAWGAPEVLARVRQRDVVLRAGGLAIVIACLAAARKEVGYWRSDEALWARALEVTADNFLAHNNIADALARDGKLDESIAHLKKAVRLNPRYGVAWDNLGASLTRQGRISEAIPFFRHALSLDPNDANAHNNLSAALAAQGDLAAALVEGSEALRLDPANAPGHVNMALLLSRKGNIRAAVAECYEALRFAPDLASAHAELGSLLMQRGQFPEAARHLRTALALDPKSAEARGALDRLAAGAPTAQARRQAARNAAKGSAEARNELGGVLLSEGKAGEAIREFREALRLRPDFAQARSNLGIALVAEGRDDEALAEFTATIKTNPDFMDARFNLAVLLYKQGRIDAAISELEGILKRHPENTKARAALAELQGSRRKATP